MHISKILKRATQLYPDRTATVDHGEELTYREVAARVAQLGAYLHARGITPGTCISILEVNSNRFLESYFAAAEIGAVASPLNTRLSAKEVSFILNDSGSKVVIANSCFADLVRDALSEAPGVDGVIWIGADQSTSGGVWSTEYEVVVKGQAARPSVDAWNPEDVAHLYYTSGTTGEPKGVILTHRNVGVHALAAIGELGLGESDVWAHIAPMFHLADAWATFAVTMVGGRHAMLETFDAKGALAMIEEKRVTITNLVPTMLSAIVSHAAPGEYDLSSVRMIMSGGAPMSPDLARRVRDLFRCEYVQTYGLTETSPYLTLSLLKEELGGLAPARQMAYRARTGRAFLPVEVKVARPTGEEVARDDKEVGEIWVRGETVSPGYWKRPEENRRAYVDGWLRTGDLAVIDSEGYVNIVDRVRDMIITGGEKVHSIEVENVICSHRDVVEAAVFGVSDDYWGEVVAAAVVSTSRSRMSEAEVMEYCRRRLSAFKVPRRVFFLAMLPKTGSGKISKKKLREVFGGKATPPYEEQDGFHR